MLPIEAASPAMKMIKLYTFPVSHFAEKVKWLMDCSKIDYQIVNWVPVLSAPAAYLKSGKRTVPFIEVTTSESRFVVHDSTNIVNWVFDNAGAVQLKHPDQSHHDTAMKIEDLADSVGNDVIRYMYAPMVQHPPDFVAVWGWGAGAVSQNTLRVMMPVMRRLLHKHLDFSETAQRAGLDRLHGVFSQIDDLLADGRSYLVGNVFSIADISIASLLAPVYTPSEHRVYASQQFQHSLASQQAEFRDYASFAWMQDLYRELRAPET